MLTFNLVYILNIGFNTVNAKKKTTEHFLRFKSWC